MKFLTALLFSLAAGWTMALPQDIAKNNKNNNGGILAGLPNGGYMIGFEDDGTPYIAAHYPLPDLSGHNLTIPASSPRTPGQKMARTKDAWGCVEEEFVDPWMWSIAAYGLADWCDAGNMVEAGKILTWRYEDSEAYICNWAGDQNCNTQEYYGYMEWPIDHFCSPNHSGWFLQGRGNIGYGRGVHGQRGESVQICFNP